MAWKSQYPDFPDLSGDALGDVRSRFQRQDKGFSEEPTDEELAQHEEDGRLYWASILKLFVDCIDTGKEVDDWVNKELRRAFHSVLAGDVWEDAIPLPGRVFKEEWYAYSPKDRRDLHLCRLVLDHVNFAKDIENRVIKVTNVIALVANEKCVSYETVRAAYYKWRGWHKKLREMSRSRTAAQKIE